MHRTAPLALSAWIVLAPALSVPAPAKARPEPDAAGSEPAPPDALGSI